MQHYALLTLAMAAHAAADCACGYSVNSTVEPDFATFTDMIETDFLHTYEFTSDTAHDIGWIPQNYLQSNNSGPCGMAKMAENVVTNPIRSIWDWGGQGIRGGDPGLQLWVKSDVGYHDGLDYVPTAEVVSERDDILYGSFRIAMKTTTVNGTCAAFFFYRNDTQEIDVEILSSQQHTSIHQWPINMVIQNTTTSPSLNGSFPESTQLEYHMAEQPGGEVGAKYHEYRFDWLPERIDFYVDSWHTATFTDNVPSTAGAIHFSHWSNGNPGWSYGPPSEDAVMTVAYIKAYFNTTGDSTSFSNHDCTSEQWRENENGLCEIPDQHASPWPGGPEGNQTGRTPFFSREVFVEHNMTKVYGDPSRMPHEGSASAFSDMRQTSCWAFAFVVTVLYSPNALSRVKSAAGWIFLALVVVFIVGGIGYGCWSLYG